MSDLIAARLARQSWIPLRQLEVTYKEGQHWQVGLVEEFRGIATVLLDREDENAASRLDYNHVSRTWPNRPYFDDDQYSSASTFAPIRGVGEGEYLVLEQSIDGVDKSDWFLHQDLLLGLDLLREGDSWVRPAEDFLEVARLVRKEDGHPCRLEIRTEHLVDYLYARKAGLAIASFSSRTEVRREISDLPWTEEIETQLDGGGSWLIRRDQIHENGLSVGSRTSVMTIARTDADSAGEAPSFDPRDDNYSMETRSFAHTGEAVWRVIAEMRRTEWLGSGDLSVRVRWDDEPTGDIRYIVEVDGSTVPSQELLGWPIRYLYFDPSIVNDLLERRTGALTWYSRDTGAIGYSGEFVHFGVNERGLINVLGKDVAELPGDHQRLFAARNVTPQGNVSEELHATQQALDPRDTIAT